MNSGSEEHGNRLARGCGLGIEEVIAAGRGADLQMVAGDSAFRIASGGPLEGHLVSAHRPPPTDLRPPTSDLRPVRRPVRRLVPRSLGVGGSLGEGGSPTIAWSEALCATISLPAGLLLRFPVPENEHFFLADMLKDRFRISAGIFDFHARLQRVLQ